MWIHDLSAACRADWRTFITSVSSSLQWGCTKCQYAANIPTVIPAMECSEDSIMCLNYNYYTWEGWRERFGNVFQTDYSQICLQNTYEHFECCERNVLKLYLTQQFSGCSTKIAPVAWHLKLWREQPAGSRTAGSLPVTSPFSAVVDTGEVCWLCW